MFDQNEDFDIDEDFLSTTSSSEIISSTPLPNGTNFLFSKKTFNSIPSPEKPKFTFKNNVKNTPNTSIFNTDEITDDNFDFDTHESTRQEINSQGNKRTFSELISNEIANQCPSNSKLKKFAFSPVKNPVESIMQILQNNRQPNNSQNNNVVYNKRNGSDKKLKQLTNSEQNIHINKPINNNQYNLKTLVQKRKFPGPAGLLPEINNIKETVNLKLPDLEEQPVLDLQNTLIPICSQDSESLFLKGPWKQMLNDYNPVDSNSNALPGKYTISWLKSTANVKQLIQQKSPFLAAIIESINDNFNVRLKDQTGEIDGVLEKEVWDTYGDALHVGSVLVLRQVGVLTFSAKRHYLNITANTIVIIYSNNEENFTVDVTKGVQYVNVTDFANSINRIREQSRKSDHIGRCVNNSMNQSNSSILQRANNPSSSSSSNFLPPANSRNIASNFMPMLKSNNFVPYSTNPNLIRTTNNVSNTYSPTINQTPSPQLRSPVTPKFNFAKSKLSTFAFSPKCNLNKNEIRKLESNKNDNSDIESIISSTFNGIDADSFFDDF